MKQAEELQPTKEDLDRLALAIGVEIEDFLAWPLDGCKDRVISLLLSYNKMYEQVHYGDIHDGPAPGVKPLAQVIMLPHLS